MGMHRLKEENGLRIDASGDDRRNRLRRTRASWAPCCASSPKVRDCLTRWIYRYATGREENPYDSAQIERLGQDFARTGQRLKPLLLDLLLNDGFVNVSPSR